MSWGWIPIHGHPHGFLFALDWTLRLRCRMLSSTDTIAAPATPTGVSAIALVRASGPRAGELAREIFGATPLPRTAVHGDFRDRHGAIVDDVVGVFFAGPNSYTGEDTLEISCHGNPFIVRKIMDDLVARGCRWAEPGEFTRRAFLNGRLELTQAEAVMDLLHARSEAALEAANRQLRGALGRHLARLTAKLVDVLARLEAYIDFPEEDLPPEDRDFVLREIDDLASETARLVATGHYGEMLRHGIRTVIVGETNAGKSSVLNRLLGENRVLVSPEPGTTRDYIEAEWVVGRHWLRLVDTAGFREPGSEIEQMGMEKSLEQIGQADLFLWVVDGTRPLPLLPPAAAKCLNQKNTVLVANKSDLPSYRAPTGTKENIPAIKFSAKTGDGLDDLMKRIEQLSEGFALAIGEDQLAVSARHAEALARAHKGFQDAAIGMKEKKPIELLASDLRESMAAIGEISGKLDNERILDRLFASFCIGK